MNVRFEGQTVFINSAQHQFDFDVVTTLTVNGIVIVLLSYDEGGKGARNIYALNASAELIWRVSSPQNRDDSSPYTSIGWNKNVLGAHNWNGWDIEIDPVNGEVTKVIESW